MALSASTMAATIVDNLIAAEPAAAQNRAKMMGYWTGVCEGLIQHIKSDMIVTSQGADPQGGVVSSTSTGVS